MIQQTTIAPLVWAALCLLAAIWGASFLSFAVALRELPVLTVVAMRVTIAALALWLIVFVRRMEVPRGTGIWGRFAVMGVLNNAMPFTLIAFGQQSIESGLAAILNASTAIFAVLVAALVFADERLTRRRFAGVLLGFCGVALVIGPEAITGLDPYAIGQLALIGSSLCYALSSAYGRANLVGLPPLTAAAGMLTMASLAMVPLALLADGLPKTVPSKPTWLAIGYISLVATSTAYILYWWVLRRAGSGNVQLVTLMVAPIAVLLGAAFLGEALPPVAFAGFALLATGLAVLDGRILRVLPRSYGRR